LILTREKKIILANKLGIDQTYQHDIICDDSSKIIINKSRAIGVSYALAFKKLIDALCRKNQYIFVSQRKENVQLLLMYIDDFYTDLDNLMEGIPKKKLNGKDMISFENGSLMLSLPNDANALRSWHGDVVLDEFAIYKDQRETLKTVKGCLKPGKKQLIINSTPQDEGDEFEKIFTAENKKDKDKRFYSVYEIPYTQCKIPAFISTINQERQEAIEQGYEEDWMQEYMCKFVSGDTRLFSLSLIRANVCYEDFPIVDPKYSGQDFAKKVDETIIRFVGNDESGMILVSPNKYTSKADYTTQLAETVSLIKVNKNIIKHRVDQTGIGIRLTEELKESDIGSMVDGVTFGSENKERMIMYLYSLLTSGRILLPNDEKLIQQLHGIERTKTASGLYRYRHQDNKHDDEVWALCLALLGYMEDTTSNNDIKIKTAGESKVKEIKTLNLWNEKPKWRF